MKSIIRIILWLSLVIFFVWLYLNCGGVDDSGVGTIPIKHNQTTLIFLPATDFYNGKPLNTTYQIIKDDGHYLGEFKNNDTLIFKPYEKIHILTKSTSNYLEDIRNFKIPDKSMEYYSPNLKELHNIEFELRTDWKYDLIAEADIHNDETIIDLKIKYNNVYDTFGCIGDYYLIKDIDTTLQIEAKSRNLDKKLLDLFDVYKLDMISYEDYPQKLNIIIKTYKNINFNHSQITCFFLDKGYEYVNGNFRLDYYTDRGQDLGFKNTNFTINITKR